MWQLQIFVTALTLATDLSNNCAWKCLVQFFLLGLVVLSTIGTLSNDDDDSSENVTKKMNLHSFQLNCIYLDPLNMSNAGNFYSWS